MVNCGVRMVNCRPRVTKHARRKITFFTRPRAPVASLAKESRVKSYIQIISSPLPPSTYLSPVLLATYTVPVPHVHTLCTFVTVSLQVQAGTSAYIIVLEGERMYVRSLAGHCPLSFSRSLLSDGFQCRRGM